jgi:hypothetical protein
MRVCEARLILIFAILSQTTVTAVYLQLVLLYIYSSREIKILKLIKVLLQKNRFIVYAASLLKRDIL